MINDYFGIQRTLRSTVLQKVVPQVREHLRQSERGWGAANVEKKHNKNYYAAICRGSGSLLMAAAISGATASAALGRHRLK